MNPIARMMKRYIKTPLKYTMPLLCIGALVLVSISGCTSPANTSPSPSASSAPTATPTPYPDTSPTQTLPMDGPLGATLTQGGLTATFGNFGPISYTQVDGGVPWRKYWQGHLDISGTIYYNPAHPPECAYGYSDGTATFGHYGLGMHTPGAQAMHVSFTETANTSITSTLTYPVDFDLIVPASPDRGITSYTFSWRLTNSPFMPTGTPTGTPWVPH